MVLESVIVEILNKFLGEYVECVDRSQLKVAFGGDVALDDLILKQNALDELDLPVKTIYGRLGKLVLTIPWTNLYKAPWVVRIERVFLLSVPLGEVKYDAEREEKQAQEAKQKELLQVEEAKKKEAEKGLDKKENATFVENLIAHVIKNLQVTIKDIHIRYEDQVTNLGSPFALGLTLSQLKLESVDEKGMPTQSQQSISLFHKKALLEGLAFYWNAKTSVFSTLEDVIKLERFKHDIATKKYQPDGYSYMFGPISAEAQLQINPKPEQDGSGFTIPKLKIDMQMDTLSIGVTKLQYRDLVKFLESMDQMARAAPYRKYRPLLHKYRGYYAVWWKFAYQCILETEVRRRRNNFNWEKIKKHRLMCRQYEAAYKEKLESKKPSNETLKLVEDLEKRLDPFNIIIMRQRAEVKVQKIRKIEEESRKNAGWFGGWWGGGAKKPAETAGTAADLANKFEAAMTGEEKSKLYQAIGYQENAAPAQYPPTFVAVKASFSLDKLQVEVQDEEAAGRCVTKLVLSGVTCQIDQRPSALANKVKVQMKRLNVTGCLQDGKEPVLASSPSASSSGESLLDVLFETNPLDRSCDQRVRVVAQPIELAYDAQTVIHLLDVFNPPEKPSLSQLQAMAVAKLEEIREVSATLLQHAIEQQKVLDLDVRFAASRLLLPQGGKIIMSADGKSPVPMLVVSLGSLSVASKPRDPDRASIGHLLQAGSTEQEVLQEMIAQSYDKFSLSLKDMQVLAVNAMEDWQGMLQHPEDSVSHLVQPTTIDIVLHRSLLPNDPRIPQFKVAGQLPSLALSLSEERLLMTAGIFVSIPFPESEPEQQPTLQESSSRTSSIMTLQQLGKVDRRKSAKSSEALDLVVGAVKLELSFEMKELRVTVLHRDASGKNERLLDFSLLALELEFIQRSFDMTVMLRLGGICMDQAVSGLDHRVISTPMADGRADYLFTTSLVMVDRKSPELHTKHKSVEKLLQICFTSLNLLLHQSAILQLMSFANNLQEKVAALQSTAPKDRTASTRPAVDRFLSVIPEDGGPVVKPAGRQNRVKKKTIELRLTAELGNLNIRLANSERELTCFTLRGVHAAVTMMAGQMEVLAALQTMEVIDLNPNTLFKKIVESEGDKALSATVVMYDNPVETQPQMTVQANMARLRIAFLNRYVSSLLAFLNNFQTAMDAVKQASAAAAEAAKQNMQQAYQNATRIELNIEINAPIVLVPRSLNSNEAFLLDFGVIILRNSFNDVPVPEAKNRVMTLDMLSLALRQLQLTRVLLDDDNKVISQTHLIRPFDFLMEVERNLSIGWCKKRAGVSLRSNLVPIVMDVRKEDVSLGMLVLAENLGDQEENIVPPETQKQIVENTSSQPKRPTTLKDLNKYLGEEGVEAVETVDSAYVTMSFLFHMASIEINLLLPVSSPIKSKEVHGLAHFTIQKLHITGEIKSDDVMNVQMKLENCFLKDSRHFRDSSESRILDLMAVKKRKTLLAHHMPMIFVEFLKTPPNSKLTATVSGFDLVLCLDYLLKVSDFFVSSMPKVDTPPAPAVPQPKLKQSESRGSSAVSRQVSSQTSGGLFDLVVKLERPDIILVESMADINTKALIFSVEGECRIKMTPERQAYNIEIRDIQFYSCCFNPQKRLGTLSQVLRPCNLSVAGGCNVGQQPTLAVDLSSVRLAVSPVTINILTNCMSALGSSQQDEIDEENKPLPDWSLLWRPKQFRDDNYWFLATDVQDVLALYEADAVAPPPVAVDGGMIMLTAASIVVTVEAGAGIKTQPLILLESRLEARVTNWATNLEVQGDLSLQMAYYNSRLALWEPLIEPVEVLKDHQLSHEPWQLSVQVKMNPQITPIASPSSPGTDFVDGAIQLPKTCISVRSEENLEVTVTRCCLDVFDALGKAFQSAIKEGLSARLEEKSPYIIQNNTGMRVILLLGETSFQAEVPPGTSNEGYEEVVLEIGAEVGLVLKEQSVLSPVRPGSSILQEQVNEKILPVKIPDKNCTIKLPMARAEKRYFSLGSKMEGLVSEVRMEAGSRFTTLRSIIQVYNQFDLPVDVYYMTKRGNEVECVGVVQPGQKLDLPLHAVYTPTGEIFFSLPGHTVCITPFIWKDLLNTVNISKTLRCDPKNKNEKDPFYLKAVGDMEQVYFEGTSMHTMSSCVFNVTLRPTVVLRNLLPVPLICASGKGQEEEIHPGGHIHLATIEPGSASLTLRLDEYLEKVWSCKRDVASAPPELSVWSFDSYDSTAKMTLDLGMHTVVLKDTLYMSLYAPFWMVNKTGLMLSYRKSRKTEKNEVSGSPLKQSEDSTNVLYHPADFVGPILFSFRPKAFFGKKKACVKIEESDWSNKFSLDVAGSSGSVSCKAAKQQYQVGVSIQLAQSNLTKLVTFTPYYMLVNHAPYAIECQEGDRPADPWIIVQPGDCAPLWPQGLGNRDNTLRLRVHGTTELSPPFSFSQSHTTLLRLHNKFGGISVDIQVSEGAIYINMSAYEPGLAPVLIINHSCNTVEFWEKASTPSVKKLAAMEECLYTWEDPRGSRLLVWNSTSCNGKKEETADMLRKDGLGKLWLPAGPQQQQQQQEIYWVSFLNGMQRVLLFTASPDVARDAQAAADLEPVDTEITLSLHGLGLSLVSQHDKRMLELLYMGIASSGANWETKKQNKTKYEPLSVTDCAILEDAYKRGLAKIALTDGTEADLELGQLLKSSRRDLRRAYHPGMWIQVRYSKHQQQFHAKLHNLQVDCQMPDCVFPIILAPVPPPKSVAADKGPRPYIEVSVVKRLLEHSQVQQFRYLRVLVQEFHVKLDMGFLGALLELFTTEESLEADHTEKLTADKQIVEQQLRDHIAIHAAQEQKNFYDELHLSPLKIHLSFSMSSGGLGKVAANSPLAILNALLQNVGVTLTDLQDVIFKLGYFERESSFLTQRQLIQEVTSHYTQQGVKQLYVLVLGLDVIGNPFGLVLGLKQGVEDLFYEPFQGAIQGPGEFAEGLKNGVRSLLGHTLSGTAAAMSRITGTVGKTLANLSFDEEYQRRRREQQMNRPAALHEGLVQSGKGLVSGVMSGVTGVITKPISGAQSEGVGGFFKGIGAGVIGLVTQPTGGVIDFASNTLDSVKRAADTADETKALRYPRYIHQDGLIRPYSRSEAFGNKLLAMVEKGRYAKTDTYKYHTVTGGNSGKEVVLLTDKRILLTNRNDLFGQWAMDWNYPWSEMPRVPDILPNGLRVYTGETAKKMMGLFKSNDSTRVIIIQDEHLRKKTWEIAKKIIEDRIPKSPR